MTSAHLVNNHSMAALPACSERRQCSTSLLASSRWLTVQGRWFSRPLQCSLTTSQLYSRPSLSASQLSLPRILRRPQVAPVSGADSADVDFRWPRWSLDARHDLDAGLASGLRARSLVLQVCHDSDVGCRRSPHSGKVAWVKCMIHGATQKDSSLLPEARSALDRG